MPATRQEQVFRIRGMDCAEEVAVLRRVVGPLVGGEDRLAFDILNGRMAILPGPTEIPQQAVQQAVASTGMRAEVWLGEDKVSDRGRFWQRRGRTVLTAASGGFTVAGFLTHVWIAGGLQAALGSEGMGLTHPVPFVAKALYTLDIVAGAWYILPKAWYAARRLRPDINLLMVIAIIGAAAIGEWLEAAVVSFLFAVSLALESWSVGRARKAIAALMDLAPPTARVKREDGTEEQVPPEQVPVGAVFIVKPGEKFPLDGRVVRGASDVNQAPITGESVPVPKQPGDPVLERWLSGT